MPAHLEGRQRLRDRLRRYADRPRERGRGQRVEHPDRAGHPDRRHRRQSHGGRDIAAEGPVHQHAVAHAEFTRPGFAEPETDLDAGGRGRQQPRRDRIVESDDGHPTVEGPRLGRGVIGQRAVPVQVVLGDVEHDAGLGPHRRRPVQLEAGQLDGQELAGTASTSTTGLPMLPHSKLSRPAAVSIACSIDVVVVLPLVPVTTSQRRGGPTGPIGRGARPIRRRPRPESRRPRRPPAPVSSAATRDW